MKRMIVWSLVAALFVVQHMPRATIEAQEIDFNTEFCLRDSYDNFMVIHLLNTTPGHFMLWGHVHVASIPPTDPEWIQYMTGAGTLYPEGHPREGIADFTLQQVGTNTHARVSGSVASSPIVYRGRIHESGMTLGGYSMTVLPDCSTHP